MKIVSRRNLKELTYFYFDCPRAKEIWEIAEAVQVQIESRGLRVETEEFTGKEPYFATRIFNSANKIAFFRDEDRDVSVICACLKAIPDFRTCEIIWEVV